MSIKKVAVHLWQSRTQVAVMLALSPLAALLLSICALPLVCAVAALRPGQALHLLLSARWSYQCNATFMAAGASGEEQDVQTYRCSGTIELAFNECVLSPDLVAESDLEPGWTMCSAAAPDPLRRRRWEEDEEEDQAVAASMFTNPLFEFEPTSSPSRCKCELQVRERQEICATRVSHPFPWR